MIKINNNRSTWYIPDMYWPEITSEGHYVSHESICVLNTTDNNCDIKITLYFENDEPKYLTEKCPAYRTKHIRMDKAILDDGSTVPRGVPYASKVECSVPVIVQYTRVDTTQSENSISSTIAYHNN